MTEDEWMEATAQKLSLDGEEVEYLSCGYNMIICLILGKWKVPFNPNDTFESEFYLDEKRSVKVPMMKIKDLTTPYIRDEELSCSVLELKYTGNASALFILPDQGKMQQVESSLQPETLKKWKDSLRPRCMS